MERTGLLTLLGKVQKRTMTKLLKPAKEVKDNSWFFIDYSNDEIPIGEKFDTLLEGPQKTLVPVLVSIKLKRVFDQIGHKLEYIPRGFQTIAQLEFLGQIPSQIKRLPSYETWDYNPEAISIAKHELIQLGREPDLVIKTLYGNFIIQFKSKVNQDSSTVTRKVFVSYLKAHFKIQDVEVQRIFNQLKVYGLVSEKRNEELELTTSEAMTLDT